MSRRNCDICNLLKDYRGRTVFIKFKCPTYFGTAGRILDIRDNLVILEYIYGGLSVTCCDNICYVLPINAPA
ncbi:MAG TPA: hypothetical protein GX396_03830 [Tissierellia bacterium]|jgi:hypothetical protein|nr:hypothetical protein [Tissierellia bacterium]